MYFSPRVFDMDTRVSPISVVKKETGKDVTTIGVHQARAAHGREVQENTVFQWRWRLGFRFCGSRGQQRSRLHGDTKSQTHRVCVLAGWQNCGHPRKTIDRGDPKKTLPSPMIQKYLPGTFRFFGVDAVCVLFSPPCSYSVFTDTSFQSVNVYSPSRKS